MPSNDSREWSEMNHVDKNVVHGDTRASACRAIQQHHPSINVVLSGQPGYDVNRASYWSSFQSDVEPHCFVEPSTAQDVASILKICKSFNCPFAVKSGGHAAFAGASSSPDGITISLKRLNELTLSADGKSTRVGTGNVWHDVYEYLTPKGLSVVGGRVSDVGTGGLTLGGGISFFSGRYGWACDGVREYELVTAEGEILAVNQTSHPDLYWALRGGGNQFGVVTRMDLETFEQGALWGGTRTSLWEQKDSLLDAFWAFAHEGAERDVDAAMWLAFAYVAKPTDIFVASSFFTHAGGIEDPDVFKDFLNLPHVASTLRPSNMTDLVTEVASKNPSGLRESYWTHTFLLTRETLAAVVDIWKEEVENIKDVPGVVPALVLQPITRSTIAHFCRNGGNALGLDDAEGPLLLMSVPTMWTDTEQDDVVMRTLQRMVERSQKLESWHRYVYMNYAARGQEVFEGYGAENLERLRSVAKRWDPERVMGRLQRGYFGLWD